MCVAMPGEVVKLNGTKATVSFDGNVIEVEAGLVKVKIGDFALVHAGCVIQVISDFDKEMLLDLISEIENA